MPKKAPRNAFFFYMLDYREQQKKLGITFPNMKELADAAGPSWKVIAPTARSKYEAMAKKEKGGLDQKFTSTGVSLAYLEQQQKEMRMVEEAELRDIKNMINLKCFDQSIVAEDFYLMDVIELCKAGPDYIIGEFTILRFNLRDGIKNSYHEFVKPSIPIGFAHDVKISLRTYGLDTLDESLTTDNYVQMLANIIDYLKQNDRGMNTLPPIFTMPEKVELIQNFIWQLCNRAAEDDALFRVYKLDTMFYTLVNAIKTNENDGFPKESLANAQLVKDVFKYTPGLACEHHEAVDKSNECTSSQTRRWAYTILDAACASLAITPRPGCHVPRDFDIESILSYREEKRERALPSVAGKHVPTDSSSCNSSIVNDSLNDSSVCSFNTTANVATASSANTGKPKRTHVPLRMPRTDYSQRVQQAPELTESNFPTLGSTGYGRGRGLASSLNKLSLNK